MKLNKFYLLIVLIAATNIYNMQSVNNLKKALITGITGQDGSYLAEFLLEKGYQVHGIIRRTSNSNMTNLDKVAQNIKDNNYSDIVLHMGDVDDISFLEKVIKDVKPDEIYNLAAQSHVQVSFSAPTKTLHTNAVSVFGILHAIVNCNLQNKTKFYQASSSEIFGNSTQIPQNETTPFHPRSPYAIAKLCAYWATVNYREAYNIFACNGILFNHESERRGVDFVTRKITVAVAKIKNGSKEPIYLGNLDAKRDWGYAKDYVEAMWLMLQQEKPDDYVISTGESHTVREFVELAFKQIGIDIIWQGEAENEIGLDKNTKQILVKIDPKFYRPTEVNYLLGNNVKAISALKWTPKTDLNKLVELMVNNDLELYR